MADDHPFLLPVVIDDTSQSGARVPEKFLSIQWVRVPGGQSNAALQSLCKRLLAGEAAAAPRDPAPAGVRRPDPPRSRAAAGLSRSFPRRTPSRKLSSGCRWSVGPFGRLGYSSGNCRAGSRIIVSDLALRRAALQGCSSDERALIETLLRAMPSSCTPSRKNITVVSTRRISRKLACANRAMTSEDGDAGGAQPAAGSPFYCAGRAMPRRQKSRIPPLRWCTASLRSRITARWD